MRHAWWFSAQSTLVIYDDQINSNEKEEKVSLLVQCK